MNGYKIVLLKAIFMLYKLPECERVCSGICSKDDYDEETSKYSYTFDKDGYVESCTVVNTEKNLSDNTIDTYTTVFTFTWE